MVVKIQSRGRCVTGLSIGAGNVRKYFRADMAAIEFELDHLQIECKLTPDFWQGDGEIQDPRLCAWLELKSSCLMPGQPPVLLTMIQSRENCFRLQPMPLGVHSSSREEPATAA